jgi:hypothetical protein
MFYRYETHLHTREASACGLVGGREYIRYYQDLGYTGIVVTDHFFGGNTAVDRSLPWPEQVNLFCAGYEAARNEGEKRGLQVLFGWEQGYRGDEYLVYGLSKAWLLEHPEVKQWTLPEQFAQAHRYGGCVVQAHPFRERSYIHRVRLNPRLVDGVEVYNAANSVAENTLAYRYAHRLGLTMFAGSDIHDIPWPQHGGIDLPEPLLDEADLARRVRERAAIAPAGEVFPALDAPPPSPTLPVVVLGEDGAPAQVPLASLL